MPRLTTSAEHRDRDQQRSSLAGRGRRPAHRPATVGCPPPRVRGPTAPAPGRREAATPITQQQGDAGGPGHRQVQRRALLAQPRRGQVVRRQVDVPAVPTLVADGGRIEPVPRLGPRGTRLVGAGVEPLPVPQHHRPVRREHVERVHLVVEGVDQGGAQRRVAPGGCVGAADQVTHPERRRDRVVTLGDRLLELVAGDRVDDVEDRAVAGEDVPLEDPHHRRRLEAERLDLAGPRTGRCTGRASPRPGTGPSPR